MIKPDLVTLEDGMRILNVGDFNWLTGRERDTANLDLFPIRSKLSNAAIRAKHYVAEFSDRAVARRAKPWGPSGASLARRAFLQMVEEARPDLILLHFADHLDAATLAEARRIGRGAILVEINIDPLPDPKNVRRLTARRDVVDAIFVTTAGEALRPFAGKTTFVAYMPNPVDPAIETGRAFAVETPTYDLILPLGDDSPRRIGEARRAPSEIVADLRAGSPSLRLASPGLGAPRLRGYRYMEALGQARMGWALSRHNDQLLYASDRMAHMMGSGLLTLLDRNAGFDRIYAPDEALFYSDFDDLKIKLGQALADDGEARARAERGWRKTWAVFEVGRVFNYILDQLYAESGASHYEWQMKRWQGL
jgi:hypothetical protein